MTIVITVKLPKEFDRLLQYNVKGVLIDSLCEVSENLFSEEEIVKVITKKRMTATVNDLVEKVRSKVACGLEDYFKSMIIGDYDLEDFINETIADCKVIDTTAKRVAKETNLVGKMEQYHQEAAIGELKHKAAVLGYDIVKID